MFPLTTLKQKIIKKSACYTTDRVKFALSFFMLSCTRLKTNRTIQNAISKLHEKGFIKVEIENRNQRKIYITNNTKPEIQSVSNNNNFAGCEDNFTGGYENNFTHNIIDNNKIDRLFSYIVQLESKIPKEFEMYEKEILEVIKKFEMNYNRCSLISMTHENIDKVKIICYCLALCKC